MTYQSYNLRLVLEYTILQDSFLFQASSIVKNLHKNELTEIQGAFITGTTVDVLPVSSIGKIKINSVSQQQIKKIIDVNKCFILIVVVL